MRLSEVRVHCVHSKTDWDRRRLGVAELDPVSTNKSKPSRQKAVAWEHLLVTSISCLKKADSLMH